MHSVIMFFLIWYGAGSLFSSYYIFKIPGYTSEKIIFSLVLGFFGPIGPLFARVMYLVTQK